MVNGREHHFRAARHPDNIPTMHEISHGLAHINRYYGQTLRTYSVAEHSLLVADLFEQLFTAEPMAVLAALMHDAHECVCGDVSTPVKAEIGDAWYAFESRQQDNLLWGFGLTKTFEQHAKAIKHCDLVALATERRDLTPFNPEFNTPWAVIDAGKAIAPAEHINLTKRSRISAFNWARSFENRALALLKKAGKVA